MWNLAGQRLTAIFIVPVEGDRGQQWETAHGWSHSGMRADCREFGPGVASRSSLASARAQGGWNRCCSQVLGSCRRTSMAAGWWC